MVIANVDPAVQEHCMKRYSTVDFDTIEELKEMNRKDFLELHRMIDNLTKRVAELESNSVAGQPRRPGRPRKVDVGEQQRFDSQTA